MRVSISFFNNFANLFVVVVAILCGSCSDGNDDIRRAQVKVDEFRSLVRAQAYSTLHDGTSKPFKAKVTAEELKEYIIPFHSEITGEPRTLIHWKTALNPNVGHLLFLYYNTGKEQQGLNEEFIFVTEENEFRLLNYRRW